MHSKIDNGLYTQRNKILWISKGALVGWNGSEGANLHDDDDDNDDDDVRQEYI